MTLVEKSIVVEQPVTTVYNQWTQFESFPSFMEGVESVRQLDDTRLHWVAKVGGARREWDATITEQVPDRKVSWTSTEGARNAGSVLFSPHADGTQITLLLDFEPDGVVEQVGDKLGLVERRAEQDLARFKEFLEARGAETGAWRGRVEGGEAR